MSKNRLAEVRKDLGVTGRELRLASGVMEATISRIERGHQTPHISTKRKLAAALGVPMWMIWPGSKHRRK